MKKSSSSAGGLSDETPRVLSVPADVTSDPCFDDLFLQASEKLSEHKRTGTCLLNLRQTPRHEAVTIVLHLSRRLLILSQKEKGAVLSHRLPHSKLAGTRSPAAEGYPPLPG